MNRVRIVPWIVLIAACLIGEHAFSPAIVSGAGLLRGRNARRAALAPSETSPAEPATAQAAAPAVKLVFVGDVMLADLPGKAIAAGKDPFAPFAPVLKAADIAVCNLECVIATSGKAIEGKPWTFRAEPRVIEVLARHFHALSLANNHSGDFGKDAFAEMLDRLKNRIPTCGGGRNLKEAHQPLILERHGLRIAILGYNEFHPREFEAGLDTPGIAWSVDEQVVADIRAARQEHKADLVIPFMHWGREHAPKSNERQQTLAHKMIEAGADLVVGNHPHCTQETEMYRGRLIVYSLGNFVFDGFERPTALRGWVLRVTMNKAGLIEWDTLGTRIDPEGLPHPDEKANGPAGRIAQQQLP